MVTRNVSRLPAPPPLMFYGISIQYSPFLCSRTLLPDNDGTQAPL
jgi:hypothetical protein